jgi:peptide/nickel transport system substrate-binding protein
MNPLVRTFSTDQSIRDLIYEPLLALDEKGDIKPKLATSWKISQDGKVLTFNLRKGVRYHNGQEMAAEDAKFAMDYTMNPKNGGYGRERLSIVERVDAPDKYTLVVYLKKPSAAFLSVLTDIMAFSLIPKGSIEEGVQKPVRFPAGTGPFKFVEWNPGQRIVFERYDDYWGQKPYLDRVILRPISDDTVRFSALRAGDVDVIERTPYEWVRQILDGKIKGIGYATAPTAGYRALFFNVTDPPFDNKKMRQAVGYAMNKSELMHAAYYGFGEPVDQKYPKEHVWNIPGIPGPTYDPAKARSLLKEAGYKGEVIDMKIEKGADVEAMATALQSQLKKVGMNIKLQVFEYGSRRDQIQKGETTIDLVGSDFYADPSTTYRQELACEPNPRMRMSNWTGYCNKQMDALHDKLETELDTQKRKAILKQIITMKLDDLPLLSIGFVPRFFTYRDTVKGFTTDGDGSFVWTDGGLTHTWLDR